MTTAREIRLPAPHRDFRPRHEGYGRTAVHPGTAIRIGEDLFEVVSSLNAGGEWIYRLEPWDTGNVIRVYVEWGSEAESHFLNELRNQRIRDRKKALAFWSQALLGFLPAKFQERLSSTLEFDPVKATLLSAVLEILVAAAPAFLFFTQFVGAGERFGRRIPIWAGFLAFAVVAEGVVRLVINVSSGEPVGSLPLALLGLRLKTEAREDVMSDEFAACGDSLEVRSPVRKAWWERPGGVMYRGEPFALVDSEHVGTNHLYRFRKGGSGFPEADPARERERNIASDRAYALAPLWGFLSREDQATLELYGRYRPRPYVRISIVFNLLLSVSIVITDMWRISIGVFGWGNVLRFAFAVVLFAESVMRLLRHLQHDEVSGSFLGVLIKPVYYMAVKSELDESILKR